MINIALICHSPTGLAILSRIIELNNLKKIKAKYTFLIDPLLTDDEIKIFKKPKNIKVEFIKIFSIEKIIKHKWEIFITKFQPTQKIRNLKEIKKKSYSFNTFGIKEFLLTFLKTYARLINIFINSIIFFSKKYDYALFSSDRTTSTITHLFKLLKRRANKIILIQLSNIPDIDFYIKNRKLSYKNYVKPNGLFGRIFFDQILKKENKYNLSIWHPEETLSMFLTGVLPRDPINIIGSLGAKNIICSSEKTYEMCIKSNFLKKQNIINSIPLDGELALQYMENKDQFRRELARKYCIDEYKTLSLFSITDLTHTNLYSEEECEEFQLVIIEKILKITKNCLLILHPRISPKRFSKLRNIYGKRLVSESLPKISSAIDIFIAFGETSSEEYLLPMGIKHIIFFKDKDDLYGNYNHYENLNLFKYDQLVGFKYLKKQIDVNFLNTNTKYKLKKGVVKLTDAIYSLSK